MYKLSASFKNESSLNTAGSDFEFSSLIELYKLTNNTIKTYRSSTDDIEMEVRTFA